MTHRARKDAPENNEIGRLFAEARAQVQRELGCLERADDEVADAMVRHHQASDRIWHGRALLRPTSQRMSGAVETVFRAHCRELLDRLARREDTRPGTAVECLLVLSDVSLAAPLTTVAAGLYFRLWATAGLPDVGGPGPDVYEAIAGSEIDDMERTLRTKLSQAWRTVPNPIEHTPGCPAYQPPDQTKEAA